MKCLLKSIVLIILMAVIFALSTSCTYNPPDGYTIKHHTYEEIVDFAKQYYVIDTDYDYYLLKKIVSEKQPDWEMKYTDIDSRYNWNNLLSGKTPYPENKELSSDELEIAWEKAKEIYQEYTSYPVRKEAWFPISIPIVCSEKENEYITYSILTMKDFSIEGKTKFFEDYEKAWDLMDSGLPIKE